MDGQVFPFEDATRPKYLDADHAANAQKALDALVRF